MFQKTVSQSSTHANRRISSPALTILHSALEYMGTHKIKRIKPSNCSSRLPLHAPTLLTASKRTRPPSTFRFSGSCCSGTLRRGRVFDIALWATPHRAKSKDVFFCKFLHNAFALSQKVTRLKPGPAGAERECLKYTGIHLSK